MNTIPLFTLFPSGARVYIDGRDLAIVRQAFPQGSTSYLFPHYRVDLVDGDRNVAVASSRVGVDRRDALNAELAALASVRQLAVEHGEVFLARALSVVLLSRVVGAPRTVGNVDNGKRTYFTRTQARELIRAIDRALPRESTDAKDV